MGERLRLSSPRRTDLDATNNDDDVDVIGGTLRFSQQELIAGCFAPVVRGILVLIETRSRSCGNATGAHA